VAYLKEQHELKQYKLLTNQSNYRLSEKGEGDKKGKATKPPNKSLVTTKSIELANWLKSDLETNGKT
jgi:hypothetical protein